MHNQNCRNCNKRRGSRNRVMDIFPIIADMIEPKLEPHSCDIHEIEQCRTNYHCDDLPFDQIAPSLKVSIRDISGNEGDNADKDCDGLNSGAKSCEHDFAKVACALRIRNKNEVPGPPAMIRNEFNIKIQASEKP